ncbi:methylation-associated defense system restriction endonuclease subunit S MAD5 [Actinomadura xylanilytica]|uniref:methylation-associated defense system restriction endonuclease subunit S MAD5 n=1 Tax=Actinomadura xylanilytica TaxID=887459 RepID=UPI00255AE963|nr:hypothetical protein [Actinomadura xylanilytica]MDL4777730.1 hypothetical protein [Actinomadura xylanilytica]
MKIAEPDNPVRYSWLADQGFRLSPGPFVSESYAARKFVEGLPRTDSLSEVTERMFHPGRVTRRWTTSPEHGVPFLSSADIFQADLSTLALITRKSYEENDRLPLEPGWTLVTRSGMTAGRVTYARLDMAGYACSEDVLRIVPDRDKIPAGYLYTFLASPLGTAMIKGTVYGTSVKHIEPAHLIDVPIPRLNDEIERRIDSLFQRAMQRRAKFQSDITRATREVFESAGLTELIDIRWHDFPRDLNFSTSNLDSTTLRALNLSPRAQAIIDALKSVPHRTLGAVCSEGRLGRGKRFTRIDGGPEGGVRLVGQRQAFWIRPEGRWIMPKQTELPAIQAKDEEILVASQGTLGDSEVFCRSVFITGRWQQDYVFSEHFLRILSGDREISGAFLFAFLRSEVMFRVLRSMSAGGKQQDIHEGLRNRIPIPECSRADRERIADTVRRAHRQRDEADALEDEAQALLAEEMLEKGQG